MNPNITRLALLTLLALSPPAWGASSRVTLDDPAGDDRGPGSYLPPSGSDYRPGDFDLRRFSVRVDGEDALLEVSLGAAVRRDIVGQRTNASDLVLDNGIYVQNIDIYIDNQPGAGTTEALPGRRAAFAPEEAWDQAVVLTPQPAATRSALEAWNKEAARRVATPIGLVTRGRTLAVRIPLWQIGGAPQAHWGWSVVVTGAVWERSFSAVDRVLGAHAPDAFTMPVYAVPEERAFGGGRLGGWHPYVIDVILPEGRDQSAVLSAFGPGRPVTIPMVYPDPAARALVLAQPLPAKDAPTGAAPREAPPAAVSVPASAQILQIASLQGDTAVIPTPGGGVNAWQMGIVLDEEGRPIGRVVVTTVADGFVLATLAEGKSGIRAGARVQFAANPISEKDR